MPAQRSGPYYRRMNDMNISQPMQRSVAADMTRRQSPARLEPVSRQPQEEPPKKEAAPEKRNAAAPENGAAALKNMISSVLGSEDSLLILLILYLLYKEKADMKLLLALCYIML